MTGAAPVSHAMADFSLDASWQGLPEQVRVEAIRALVNWMGCAVGGATTVMAAAAAIGVVAMEPEGRTPVIGRSERVGLASSAMLACINSSAHTFDDTHLAFIAAAEHAKWGKIVRDAKITAD